MELQSGQTLLHYRLTAQIGEGGMGVVWKAEDTTLGRDVAIKVLPAMFATDAERLARFEREAKLLASLNHNNIATIHGLHEAEGLQFLVMELLEGENLQQRLARGPLPVEEALRVARRVAEALEAAHEKGVIHRDLKPANVHLAEDGAVKVLDFGLAKAFETTAASSGDLQHSPTMTASPTAAGMILGTASYMSPEQARGKVVDKQSDIWSFGALLYELLCARKAFPGETVSDTIASIIKGQPDWEALPADTPPRIRELIERCVEKNARDRLHDIADARLEIVRVLGLSDSMISSISAAVPAPATKPRKPSRGMLVTLLLAGVVIGAAATALFMATNRPAQSEKTVRKFLLDDGRGIRVPIISPDGERIVFVDGDKLWLREMNQTEPHELPTPRGGFPYGWSPDGRNLIYHVGDSLYKLPVTGGEPTLVAEMRVGYSSAAGAAWGADGRIVFCNGAGGLLEVSSQGGDAAALLEPNQDETDFHSVGTLPGGRGFVFIGHRKTSIDTIAVFADGKRKTILQLPGQDLNYPVYSPSGHIVFRRSPAARGLWAVPFSLARLEVTGEPFPIVQGGTAPSVSNDGTLVYFREAPARMTQLVRVDRQGQVKETIGEPQMDQLRPRISPDGRRVVLSAEDNNNRDLWIHDAVSGTKMRLTFDSGGETNPTWTNSGEHVAYRSGRGALADATMKFIATNGSGDTRDLPRGNDPEVSPDGKFLVYAKPSPALNWGIAYIDLEDVDAEPTMILDTNGDERSPVISPNGRYVAFTSNESGQREIYLKRFPEGSGKWQVSTEGGELARWSAKGDKLFYSNGRNLMEVDVTAGDVPQLSRPRNLFERDESLRTSYDVMDDGNFLMVRFVDDDAPSARIVVVQNWAAEFD